MQSENAETQFTVRCSNKMKDDAERLAKLKGQSLNEWARRAILAQIEYESTMNQNPDASRYVTQEQLLSILTNAGLIKQSGIGNKINLSKD